MTIRVRLFAAARQLAGRESLSVEVPGGATVAELRQAMARLCPELATLLPHVVFAVDAEYAGDADRVAEGCEVACIPPVSGG
jgi:sulfur-carrier protein